MTDDGLEGRRPASAPMTDTRRDPLPRHGRPARTAAWALALLLAACGSDDEVNVKPAGIGPVSEVRYDGSSDDLLTAGLGRTGLGSATAPTFANAAAPTATELRRLAIWNNYRALADMTAAGGYGRLYGPNIDLGGNDTLGEGRIAGRESLAFLDDGTGRDNVTLMVQVPDSFDVAQACIVAAPSSGSRGVYGAIGTTGEWGLKRGCAVAYTDKGTGNGAHDLSTDTVTLIDGRLAPAATAGTASLFTAPLAAGERAAFDTASPNRFAFKHAHSQRNPEKDWGLHTRRAIEFAFYVLNEQFGRPSGNSRTVVLKPENTIVIASSVSNGGGAVLAAAEEDGAGLIDGVVASEPQINLDLPAGITVRRGAITIESAGRPLYDYVTLANLYQPCAAIAASNAASPFLSFVVATRAANRCTALAGAGLLSGTTTAERADEALQKLRAGGYEPAADLLHASHYGFSVAPAVAVTYANAYTRSKVTDNLCGYSFGATSATTGAPVAAAAASMLTIAPLGNGIPPSNGINLINRAAANGPINDPLAVSPSTGLADYHFDAANCLRQLLANSALTSGIDATRKRANLRGKPALIVHGRSDALIPVNHTSRPYVAMNQLAEGVASRVRYIEVTNAQHFEAFLGLAGYDTRFVPLHVYGIAALNLMWNHLKQGAALPPSQLVRTLPRGGTPGAAPAIAASNLPPIAAQPAAGDLIEVGGGVIVVPE